MLLGNAYYSAGTVLPVTRDWRPLEKHTGISNESWSLLLTKLLAQWLLCTNSTTGVRLGVNATIVACVIKFNARMKKGKRRGLLAPCADNGTLRPKA
jgi:hypothetical protein